ncbi:MAG: hypothetical protein IPM94_13405 [bacterium]|nr:hypothetical protein [bacterium]
MCEIVGSAGSGKAMITVCEGEKTLVMLNASSASVIISDDGSVAIKGGALSITVDGGIEITSRGSTAIKADGNLSLEASGEIAIKGAMIRLN